MQSNKEICQAQEDELGQRYMSHQEQLQAQIDAQGRANVSKHKFLKQFQTFSQLLEQFRDQNKIADIFTSKNSIQKPSWANIERVPESTQVYQMVQPPRFQALTTALLRDERPKKQKIPLVTSPAQNDGMDATKCAGTGGSQPSNSDLVRSNKEQDERVGKKKQFFQRYSPELVNNRMQVNDIVKIICNSSPSADTPNESLDLDDQYDNVCTQICAYVDKNINTFEDVRRAYSLDTEICRSTFSALENYLQGSEHEDSYGYSYTSEYSYSEDQYDFDSELGFSSQEKEKLESLLSSALKRVSSNKPSQSAQIFSLDVNADVVQPPERKRGKSAQIQLSRKEYGPFPAITYSVNRQEHKTALRQWFCLNLRLNGGFYDRSGVDELMLQTTSAALNLFYYYFHRRPHSICDSMGRSELSISKNSLSAEFDTGMLFQIQSPAGSRWITIHEDDLSIDGPNISQRTPFSKVSPHYRAGLRELLEIIGFCIYLITAPNSGRVLHIFQHHFCIQDTQPDDVLLSQAIFIPDQDFYHIYRNADLAGRIGEMQKKIFND